jgi:two-component system, OmpR family, response regulator
MRVLLVEDEVDLAHVVRRTLEEEGHACDWAAEGLGALHQARTVSYDAVVLDLMLPGLDGWSILGAMREEQVVAPVLVLTARDALDDRVRGLDLGADDYLTKPFALAELLARLRALHRRAAARPSPVMNLGWIRIDTAARTVWRDEKEIPLTAKEYALLELLALRRGSLVARREIYEHLYSDDSENLSNVLDVYVANLRRKLGHDLIRTRRGQGYIIP